jgi:uncharacterized protein YggE
MRKIIILSALLFLFTLSKAQQPVSSSNPFPKTITVTGSAEMEVIPDEIIVQVDLREYEKKGQAKTDIETIKTEFLNNCRNIGIADSAISIASYQGYSGYQWWKRKKKNNDLLAAISYQVKLKSSYQVDKLVDVLNDEATQNFQVINTTHSNIREYRKQLKIQAVKLAKEKGIYLAEAIDEKIGEAVSIEEPADVSVYYYNVLKNQYYEQAKMGNAAYRSDFSVNRPEEGIDFKKMKLKFDVKIVFALK